MGRPGAWPVALCAAISLVYLATLGWDEQYDVAPGGSRTGPWEAWQISVFVALLAAIVVGAQLRGARGSATLIVPATVTGWWSWSAIRTADGGPSFWPIGAAAIFVGTLACVALSQRSIDVVRSAPPGGRTAAWCRVAGWCFLAGALATGFVGSAAAVPLFAASVGLLVFYGASKMRTARR